MRTHFASISFHSWGNWWGLSRDKYRTEKAILVARRGLRYHGYVGKRSIVLFLRFAHAGLDSALARRLKCPSSNLRNPPALLKLRGSSFLYPPPPPTVGMVLRSPFLAIHIAFNALFRLFPPCLFLLTPRLPPSAVLKSCAPTAHPVDAFWREIPVSVCAYR